VKIGDGKSDACSIGRGVRQGCSLSRLLYIIYDEAIVKEALGSMTEGVMVGGRTVNSIR